MKLNRIVGLLAFPLLGACAVLESQNGPRVSLNVSTQPIDLFLGDTAYIAIVIRNVGDRELSVSSAGCNMDFFISDLDGNAFTPAETVYCTLELRAPISLDPGETHRIEAFTTGRVVPQGAQSAPITLPAGTYRVRPVVSVHSGDETAVVVSAEPVIVTFR
jgi:hypothetical protein